MKSRKNRLWLTSPMAKGMWCCLPTIRCGAPRPAAVTSWCSMRCSTSTIWTRVERRRKSPLQTRKRAPSNNRIQGASKHSKKRCVYEGNALDYDWVCVGFIAGRGAPCGSADLRFGAGRAKGPCEGTGGGEAKIPRSAQQEQVRAHARGRQSFWSRDERAKRRNNGRAIRSHRRGPRNPADSAVRGHGVRDARAARISHARARDGTVCDSGAVEICSEAGRCGERERVYEEVSIFSGFL